MIIFTAIGMFTVAVLCVVGILHIRESYERKTTMTPIPLLKCECEKSVESTHPARLHDKQCIRCGLPIQPTAEPTEFSGAGGTGKPWVDTTDIKEGKIWLEENMSYEGVKKNGEPAGWYAIPPVVEGEWEKEFNRLFANKGTGGFTEPIRDFITTLLHSEREKMLKEIIKEVEEMNNFRQGEIDGNADWNNALRQSQLKVDALLSDLRDKLSTL